MDEYKDKYRAFLEGLEADHIDQLMELDAEASREVGADLKSAFVKMASMSEEVLELCKKLVEDPKDQDN